MNVQSVSAHFFIKEFMWNCYWHQIMYNKNTQKIVRFKERQI